MSGCGGCNGGAPGYYPAPPSCYDVGSGVSLPDRRLLLPKQPIPIEVGDIAEFAHYIGPQLILPLPIEQGNSLSIQFRAFRFVNHCHGQAYGSGPQTLTGFEGAGTLRKAKGFPLSSSLTVTVDQTGPGSPTQGIITVSATPEQTTLYPQFGVYDVELFTGIGTVLRKTIIEGPIMYNRAATLAVV